MKGYSCVVLCSALMSLLNTSIAAPSVSGRWVSFDAGYAFSSPSNTLTIQSMPNINQPDNYLTTGLGNRGLVGAGLGWQFDLPAYYFETAMRTDRLGLMYDYYAPATVTGQINKYQQIPTYYTNYRLTSNVLWVDNQLDLIPVGQFLPFFDVAIGASWNATSQYTEGPLPGVPSQMVRISSAAFASRTTASFAWRVGAGGSFPVTDKLVLGVLYHYADLGSATTGPSLNYPTASGISTGTIAQNEWVMTLRYHFDGVTKGDMK